MEIVIVVVIGLLAITGTTLLSSKLGVATPLLLVVLGIGVSLLPFVPEIEIEPEWVLAGLLPPLLYAASVSMPAMDFRREFAAISGLSVFLVVISAVILGVIFSALIPDLSLAWGIALGAIVSPTDAVATSIVKRVGLSPRVVTMLEGESLLNDATALVVLRTAIAAAAATVSFWGVLGAFVYAIVVAAGIGFAVGKLNLFVRSRISDATVSTVLSFTIPFLASIPSELLGASGLVGAVVAGLVSGHGAVRHLPPRQRLADEQNWKTIEYVLEGTVFLTMGLELSAIVEDVREDHAGVLAAIGIAAVALGAILLVRALYVVPLLRRRKARAERGEQIKEQVAALKRRVEADELDAHEALNQRRRAAGRKPLSENAIQRLRRRWHRAAADIDYFLAQPLGWREGSVIVWAGMRGAVTLAAAQTLPTDTPGRSFLVLIAFTVAVISLLVQGSTLVPLVRLVKPAQPDPLALAQERVQLEDALYAVRIKTVAHTAPGSNPDGHDASLALRVIAAQREFLLDARDRGTYAAHTLQHALTALDADQVSIEIRSGADVESAD